MIVVDASGVVGALAMADVSAQALREHLVGGDELHAPALLDFEVVSALRRMTLRGQLSAPRAQDLLTDFEDLRVERWPFADALRRRAFALRENVSAYDAAYVALAEALECPLLTRDLRLARSSGHDAHIVAL